jgi:hypothetical protein
MKTIKQFVAASVVLASVSVYANYTVSVTGGAATPTANGSATASSPYAAGTTPVNNILTTFSFNTVGGSGALGQFSFSPDVYVVPGAVTAPGASDYYGPSGADAVLAGYASISSVTLNLVGGGSISLTDSGGTWDSPTGVSVGGSQAYTVTVDWNINSSYLTTPNWSGHVFDWTSYYDLTLNGTLAPGAGTSLTHGGTGYINSDAYVSAVPEPSQVIGGCMLLGCGALVFTGRRFMAKRA